MTIFQDLRTGARILRRHRGFTVSAVLTLSLGITGTVTVLAVLRTSFVMSPLVNEPGRIVRLFSVDPRVSDRKFSIRDYQQLQEHTNVFAGVAAYSAADVELRDAVTTSGSASGEIRRAVAHRVSGNYFSMLGVPLSLGRGFSGEQDRKGAAPVGVLSHSLWQRDYGGTADVIGRTFDVNGREVTVIGVAPAEFRGIDPTGPDLWLPYVLPLEAGPGPSEEGRSLYLLARLQRGVTITEAAAAMSVVAQRWSADRQGGNARHLVTTISVINAESRGRLLPLISLVLAAVGFVLLIACANVANLLLARGVSRQREISTRLALGASRWQIVRQLLAESVLLSLLGAIGGALLAQWTTPLLYLAVTTTAGRPPGDPTFEIDAWVFGATAVVSLCSAVLFGLAPALQATRANLVSALKMEGSAVHQRVTASRMRSLLVVGQVALSLVLLTGAGLFTRAMARAHSFDLGFDADNLLVVTADPRRHGYDASRTQAFYRAAEERFTSMPGVRSVSLVRVVPATDLYLGDVVSIEGQAPASGDPGRAVTYYDFVSSNYFASLEIPVVRGRVFSTRDRDMVVVNEAFVRRFMSGADPVGTRIQLGAASSTSLEIVGVVKDVMHGRPGEPSLPLVYRSVSLPYPAGLSFLVQATTDREAVRAALARQMRDLDPRLPFSVRTMRETVRSTMWPARIGALLSAVLGLLAVALAAVGLFGVMAYTVSQRTREVGIRMALGATRNDVMKWMLRRAFAMIGAGLVIGVLVTAAFSRAVSMFLFGLSPWDPLTFLGCATLLTSIGAIASYLPARHASGVDLTAALRRE